MIGSRTGYGAGLHGGTCRTTPRNRCAGCSGRWDGAFEYPLDNGAVIRVRVRIDPQARRAVVDFTGTSAQLADNFNAPAAVCRAAVLYVFRTLVDEPIPMNEGCLKPIEIVILEGCMLNPRHPAAVVAGNVETIASPTRCTARRRAGGGAGHDEQLHLWRRSLPVLRDHLRLRRRSDFDGTSAVHTHDQLSTDRSGGAGVALSVCSRATGSIAARRRRPASGRRWHHPAFRFLEPMAAALLSNHRIVAPFGSAGGAPAAAGSGSNAPMADRASCPAVPRPRSPPATCS